MYSFDRITVLMALEAALIDWTLGLYLVVSVVQLCDCGLVVA
jgi:hypothetical protein